MNLSNKLETLYFIGKYQEITENFQYCKEIQFNWQTVDLITNGYINLFSDIFWGQTLNC